MQIEKSTLSYWIMSLIFSIGGNVAGDDFTADKAGDYSFAPGVTRGALINAAEDGMVTFSPDGDTSADNRITFTSFDAAVSGAQTTFNGGFWDFGATFTDESIITNFCTGTATLSNRRTLLTNGANVTGIDMAWIAGSSGSDNSLSLTGASSMTLRRLVFGSKSTDQRSVLSVTDGSSLTCSEDVYLNRKSVSTDSQSRTDNELLVSGVGSKMTVGGVLSIGGDGGGNLNWGFTGGNTVRVDDGATASWQAVQIGTGTRQGKYNKVVLGKDAQVSMTSLKIASSGSYEVSSNIVEIIDGAIVNNTGSFVFGRDKFCGYNTFLISNAVFSTKSVCNAGTSAKPSYCLLPGANSEIRLSGQNAQFNSEEKAYSIFEGSGSRFVVENNAQYTIPARFGSNSSNETLVVRSGATVKTADGGDLSTMKSGINNTITVEEGSLEIGQTLYVAGCGSALVVSNGNVSTKRSIIIGSDSGTDIISTNCTLVVQGRSPEIAAYYQLKIFNGSTLRIELPPEGYADSFATSDKPVIKAGQASGEMGIKPDATSRIELGGAQAMLNYFAAHNMSGEYVLMRTNKNIKELDGLAEKLQRDLPYGMTVTSRTKNNKWELVLTVEPHKGLRVILR